MNKRILYTQFDGSVAVIIPAVDCGLSIEEIAAKDVPKGVVFEIVDVSEIPTERTFRNAWKQKGAKVEYDMEKAKNIAHEKRREDRVEAFKPLDIEATIPTKAVEAEVKRQVIRSADAVRQAAIDAAIDIPTLKTLL